MPLDTLYIIFIEFTQSFGLLIRWPEDPQDKLLMFRLPGEEINRKELTEQIARLMADSKSSANTVSESTGIQIIVAPSKIKWTRREIYYYEFVI